MKSSYLVLIGSSRLLLSLMVAALEGADNVSLLNHLSTMDNAVRVGTKQKERTYEDMFSEHECRGHCRSDHHKSQTPSDPKWWPTESDCRRSTIDSFETSA